MKKILLITSEFGREKGGIQNWMFYVQKFLNLHLYDTEVYAYKENNPLAFIQKLFLRNIYILATWKMSLFTFPLLLLRNKKIFIFVHGNEVLNLNQFQKMWLVYLSKQKHIYFIANSHAIAEVFFNVTQRTVDSVQYPFLEIVQYPPVKVETKILTFLTISRLVKRKNIDHILVALRQLKNEGLKFKYYIGGRGEEQEVLVNLIRELSLEKEVTMLGYITENMKDELYSNSDYFLLPSIYDKKNGSIEGYGIVFIEANSYGLPVLSGDTGGMTEAVLKGKTGYHCNGSVEDIVEKIQKLLNTSFSVKLLKKHAERHNYLNQKDFLLFIQEKINE